MDIENKEIIIAIDGYSSTGKSSFAKLIASRWGFLYLDSGALYRAVTLFALDNGLIEGENIDEARLSQALASLDVHFENHDGQTLTYMGSTCVEKEIRTMRVSSMVSPIATLGFVRNFVNDRLHQLAVGSRVVMDGRDIGTTVFPQADVKIFMEADPKVRAERRMKELVEKGEKVCLDEILNNLSERDRIDSSRAISPLRKAEDALVLNNTDMTFEQQMDWLQAVLQERFGR